LIFPYARDRVVARNIVDGEQWKAERKHVLVQ